MQHTHRLAHLARHLFIDLPEGRFLLDTASPRTFGTSGTATYGGVSHAIPRSVGAADAPITVESLAGLDLDARIGQRLKGVLGMDLIGGAMVLWDGPRGRAIVRPDAAIARDAVRVPIELHAAGPMLRALLGGRESACLLDTGAQFGFVSDAALGELGAADGEFDDFDAELGAIRSAAWRIPVDMHGVRFRERFGCSPVLAERVLRGAGADALIGCSWMPTRRVWFAPAEGAMWVAQG